MKLNKKTWLFIGLGIFGVAAIGMGLVVFQQVEEQGKLSKQLTLAQTRLRLIQQESLSSQPPELEKQLGQVTSEFQQVGSDFPKSINSTDAANTVFNLADDMGLTVIELTSSSPIDESTAGITLSAMHMTVTVVGNVPKVVEFITALNNILKTSAVKSADISVPETTNGANATASIELVIYAYRGE